MVVNQLNVLLCLIFCKEDEDVVDLSAQVALSNSESPLQTKKWIQLVRCSFELSPELVAQQTHIMVLKTW